MQYNVHSSLGVSLCLNTVAIFLLYVIQIVGLATNNLGPVNAAFFVILLPKSLQYQNNMNKKTMFELSMNYLCRINKD